MSLGRVLVCLTLACPVLAGAEERTLYWDELSVRARLDAEGVLHVEELQAKAQIPFSRVVEALDLTP